MFKENARLFFENSNDNIEIISIEHVLTLDHKDGTKVLIYNIVHIPTNKGRTMGETRFSYVAVHILADQIAYRMVNDMEEIRCIDNEIEARESEEAGGTPV
jgi:hypothetical protein